MGTDRRLSAPNSFYSNRSDLLKQARVAAGYSVEDLAVATGLTHGEIIDIENGHDEHHGRLQRVAAVFQVSL